MYRLFEEGPVATDSNYFQWVNVNSILFSWLLESMKPDIVEFLEI